jgi:hypothetical protein
MNRREYHFFIIIRALSKLILGHRHYTGCKRNDGRIVALSYGLRVGTNLDFCKENLWSIPPLSMQSALPPLNEARKTSHPR